MTLRIITGSLIDGRDTFGRFRKLISDGLLQQWIFTESGWRKQKSNVVSLRNDQINIIQTTGSGKTILCVIYAYIAYLNNVKIGGNLSLKWSENNIGKSKKYWEPVIKSMDDLINAHNMHITIDDIRGTITSWNSKEAKLTSECANGTRKKHNFIDISTQRIENFVPRDLMLISDEIIVPFIRIFDIVHKAPDGRGSPLQLIALRFSPGYDFLDYKVYNLNSLLGTEILNGFDTLQLAIGLNNKNIIQKEPRSGYNLEEKVYFDLQRFSGTLRWLSKEKPQKKGHETDIIYTDNKKTYFIDAVALVKNKNYFQLETKRKDFSSYNYGKDEPIRLLAYEYNQKIYYIEYKYMIGYSGNIRLSKFVKRNSFLPENKFRILKN